MPQEVESRYRARKRAQYEQMLRLDALGPYTLSSFGWKSVRDCYLDTDDRALTRQGWACRLRCEDGMRHSVTLKGPSQAEGPGVNRLELVVALKDGTADPSDWPRGELRSETLRLTARAPLVPLVRLRQRRYILAVREGQRLAAWLYLDRLRVSASEAHPERYLVECELADGGALEDLAALDKLLVGACDLRREPRSKQALALRIIQRTPASPKMDSPPAAATPLTPKPKDSPAQAAAKILALHLGRMTANEPGVRQGIDPEAVHDMRVAIRRMRSALRFFGPYLDDPRLASMTPRLQCLAGLLGGVRDLDVAMERAHAFAEASGAQRDLEPLLAVWKRRRDANHRLLVRYLDSPGHVRWVERWRSRVARQATRGAGGIQIGRLAPLLIHVHWQAVWIYDPFIGNSPIETLHALRIESKRLRYGLEFCETVLRPDILKWIPEVTALQDHLGTLNDHAIAIAMLDAVAEEHGASLATEGLAAYRAHCEEQMALLVESLPARWDQFTRRETRRAFQRLGGR